MQEAKRWTPLAKGLLAVGGVLLAVLYRSVFLSLLLKILIAALLAWLLCPLCKEIERRLGRGLAAVLSVLSFALFIFALFALLLPPLGRQFAALYGGLPQALQSGYEGLCALLGRMGVDSQRFFEGLSQGFTTLGVQAFSILRRGAGGVASFVSTLLIALVLCVYFLKDRELFLLYLSMLIPLRYRKRCLYACAQIRRELTGYVRGQLLVSMSVAALTALGLFVLRVPYYLVLGLLMGLLDVIPYFGPVIGAIPIALFSLQRGINGMIWAMVVVVLVQQVEASLLCPRVMGESTGLHPVTVMLALLLGGSFFGIAGMLGAVPCMLCARALFRVLRSDP